MTPGTHGTTYGGNALAVAVGAAVLELLCEDGFLTQVCSRAEQLHAGLEQLCEEHPEWLDGVRGKGLLAGFKVKTAANTDLRDRLRESGLLVGVAGDNVVRLAPPLNVSSSEINIALDKLSSCISSFGEAHMATSVVEA
jgi:acetylornithine/N-succinyldiaminopimelate aminotransferase